MDETFILQNFTHQTSPSNIKVQIFFHVLENFITQQTKQHSNNNQPLKWILQLYNLSWVKETFCKCSFTKHQPAQPPNYHTNNQATNQLYQNDHKQNNNQPLKWVNNKFCGYFFMNFDNFYHWNLYVFVYKNKVFV